MKKTNEFPSGWDERRVREVLEYYENQSDEDAVAEHEAALTEAEPVQRIGNPTKTSLFGIPLAD